MVSEYDSSFLCTYKNIDDDDLYRIQFLQAFKLDNWDDKLINSSTPKRKITILYQIRSSFVRKFTFFIKIAPFLFQK